MAVMSRANRTVAAPANPSTTDVFPTPPFRLNTLTTAITVSLSGPAVGHNQFLLPDRIGPRLVRVWSARLGEVTVADDPIEEDLACGRLPFSRSPGRLPSPLAWLSRSQQ